MELKNKFFILFLPIIFSSCSYYSFKGSLPANIDNISISPILNESTEYVVTDILDEEIYNILLKENVLKLVGIDNAKSKLDITIKSVTDKYYTYSLGEVQYEIVDEWKISVKAKVEWYDLLEDKVIFSKEMTSFGIYSTNSGNDISVDGIDNDQDGLTDNEDNDEFGPPRESALKIASKKLSENIIANITSTW
ncbi:MAG: hypothetical protein CMG11_01790 [Candidatus Marinimicrobia bacterium]|jgi:hypothetical protein|nr:hypothetical protein [Candidatus Neomarinimicrobiota bacterium]